MTPGSLSVDPAVDAALRLVQVGAGGMGRAWLRTIAGSPSVELVALVDLDLAAARRAATEAGFPDVEVATSLSQLDLAGRVDAVLNVTVPAAHHSVTTEALLHGLPVLSEKPMAESVSQALSMVATAEVSGQLLMVSQSRHYWANLSAYRRQISQLGRPASLSGEFFKAAHQPGFREEMAYPLLVDMAIHHFDLARDLLGAEPVSVYCESANPAWSWFRGDASATAVFMFEGGARFSYAGSWCCPGLETSWNGRWRLAAEHGAAVWDGDHPPEAERDGQRLDAEVPDEPEQIAASLAEFVGTLRDGGQPWGEAHSNALSLAMVEAAVRSAQLGRRVLISDVLTEAHAAAVRDEKRDEVRARLESWPSVTEVLGRRPASA